MAGSRAKLERSAEAALRVAVEIDADINRYQSGTDISPAHAWKPRPPIEAALKTFGDLVLRGEAAEENNIRKPR